VTPWHPGSRTSTDRTTPSAFRFRSAARPPAPGDSSGRTDRCPTHRPPRPEPTRGGRHAATGLASLMGGLLPWIAISVYWLRPTDGLVVSAVSPWLSGSIVLPSRTAQAARAPSGGPRQ
jgi:hypothetical protein